MTISDAELAQRSLAGDESSARELVARYQSTVFALCFRMLGQRQDAEDVAQESFLRAFRSMKSWDPQRPFKPWLLAIAANRCRTQISKRARRPLLSEYPEEIPDGMPRSQPDLAEELERGLSQLRAEHRMCFILYHHHNLSVNEIGETLECPAGTVKTWLHRARKQLAAELLSRGVVPEVDDELHRV